MSVTDILHKRPLPTFEQWLEKDGGPCGGGFEAFRDLAQRTHDAADGTLPGLKAPEQTFLRMWTGMQIAIIELCNIEQKRGREPAEIIVTISRVLGAAAMYSTASVTRDDAPMRTMARVLIEEFRFGAKEAADQLEQRRDDPDFKQFAES